MHILGEQPDIFWHNQRRDQIATFVRAQGVVLLPTGAIEQHGPHLPVSTDICSSTAIAAEAARRVREFPVLVAPPVWWGLSPYHMVFPGTITLRAETLATQGIPAAALSYWNIIPEAMRVIASADAGNIGHAGEAETSLQLHLQPDLVDATLVTPDVVRAFETGNGRGHNEGVLMAGAYTPPNMLAESSAGVLGDPTAASVDKGARLLDAAADRLAEFVRRYRARTLTQVTAAQAV
jgi:creatinine amidohydrolase